MADSQTRSTFGLEEGAGGGGIVAPFLTSALDGGEWSASRPCCFTPATDWTGGVLASDSAWKLWRREKSCSCQDSKPGRPARSRPLYRLLFPQTNPFNYIYTRLNNNSYFQQTSFCGIAEGKELILKRTGNNVQLHLYLVLHCASESLGFKIIDTHSRHKQFSSTWNPVEPTQKQKQNHVDTGLHAIFINWVFCANYCKLLLVSRPHNAE
jgi:hypothetical protein